MAGDALRVTQTSVPGEHAARKRGLFVQPLSTFCFCHVEIIKINLGKVHTQNQLCLLLHVARKPLFRCSASTNEISAFDSGVTVRGSKASFEKIVERFSSEVKKCLQKVN